MEGVIGMPEVSEDQIRAIAEQVSSEVVKQLLLALGINTNDPGEIVKLQKDFALLRSWRENVDTVKNKGLAAAVGFVVTAILGLIVAFIYKH